MKQASSDDDQKSGSRNGDRGEVFLFGSMRFNVDRGLALVAEVTRQAQRVQVAPWAEFFGFSNPKEKGITLLAPRFLDPDYAMTIDLEEPVLIASIRSSWGELLPLLIDGTHRIYKAYTLGVSTLPSYVLDDVESLSIRDDQFIGTPDHWLNYDWTRAPEDDGEPPRGGTA
jgi:hypothetical protein